MDSEIELSDDDTFDYGSERSNPTPFPTECPNEIEGIESFYRCFIHRYSACPAFFMGTLQEACESAFSSSAVKEHRPILVYIHNDNSLSSNIFCSSIFCSEIMIDYLLENYIVWPWDITHEFNRNTLMRVWTELFSTVIRLDRCPMLIVIMRSSGRKRSWSFESTFRFRVLLENDQLMSMQVKLTRERLLSELMTFKEQSDQNEQRLLFDFATTTGLPWDIILEIARYLTLEDAVIAFSPKILPLFHKYKTQLHLSTSSKPFIDMMLKTLNPEQIISFQFNASCFWSPTELFSLSIFTNITSLILLNIHALDQLHHSKETFPNLTNLSLYYDYEINFFETSVLVSKFPGPIKRLAIHCVASFCIYSVYQLGNVSLTPDFTIKYFLLDIRHFLSLTRHFCHAEHPSCFFMQLINLIETMKNIRTIRFLVNKDNLEKLLDVKVWKSLLEDSRQLKKVTLQVMESALPNEELTQTISQIQKLRPTTKFQVLFC